MLVCKIDMRYRVTNERGCELFFSRTDRAMLKIIVFLQGSEIYLKLLRAKTLLVSIGGLAICGAI